MVTVSPSLDRDLLPPPQADLRQLYSSVCELIRHFWDAFPPNTPDLAEKVELSSTVFSCPLLPSSVLYCPPPLALFFSVLYLYPSILRLRSCVPFILQPKQRCILQAKKMYETLQKFQSMKVRPFETEVERRY